MTVVKKKGVSDFKPVYIDGRFYICIRDLKSAGLEHLVVEKKDIGRFIPVCMYGHHKGAIEGQKYYSCERKGCRHYRRFVEEGSGDIGLYSDNHEFSKLPRGSGRKKRK